VCIVPRENAAEALAASQARIAKEEKAREKLRAGELGLDFYGLRAKLTELGVVYVDQDSD
jgi:4-hydroxy-4-methyl-2-oxoglutarate aldolase